MIGVSCQQHFAHRDIKCLVHRVHGGDTEKLVAFTELPLPDAFNLGKHVFLLLFGEAGPGWGTVGPSYPPPLNWEAGGTGDDRGAWGT